MGTFLHIRRRQLRLERPCGLLLRGDGHGAFAAGYIDALLEAGLRFDAISAAGGGVANAVVLAFGLAHGNPTTARKALQAFWRLACPDPMATAETPEPRRIEAALRRIVDLGRLQSDDGVSLFVAASNALTGQPRLLSKRELGIDTVLAAMTPAASARAVDGQLYCSAGVHEELAVLPLTGDHRLSEIVTPFLTPARRARAARATVEDLWALGRSSATAWMVGPTHRARHRPLDEATPLAA
jgi:NTE family protein